HSANPVCTSCHARMDALGFALENFDATGRWRTREGDTLIDACAALPDGTRFSGPTGLRNWLMAQPEAFATSVTEKLMIYALGRGLEYYDAPAVRKIVRASADGGYKFQALILGVVRRTPLQTSNGRGAEAGGPPSTKVAGRCGADGWV